MHTQLLPLHSDAKRTADDFPYTRFQCYMSTFDSQPASSERRRRPTQIARSFRNTRQHRPAASRRPTPPLPFNPNPYVFSSRTDMYTNITRRAHTAAHMRVCLGYSRFHVYILGEQRSRRRRVFCRLVQLPQCPIDSSRLQFCSL